MSSMERENNFQQEETPEEIRERLQREEENTARLKEMESIPDYKRVSSKLERVSPEEKRQEAQRMVQGNAKIDAAEREQLNRAYAEKPQDEKPEIVIGAGKKRGQVEFRKRKAA